MSISQSSTRRSSRHASSARSYREVDEDDGDDGSAMDGDNSAAIDADDAASQRPRGRKRRSNESSAASAAADEYADDDEKLPSKKRVKQTRKGKQTARASPDADEAAAANGVDAEELEGDDGTFTAEDRYVEDAQEQRQYTLEELGDDSDIHLEAVTDDVRAGEAEEEEKESRGAREPEAGVIIRVKLTNFMIHQKFTIDFNPHVTFIHGHNGSRFRTLHHLTSPLHCPIHIQPLPLTALVLPLCCVVWWVVGGKSAVLVALQCVFGARALDTNRGSTVAQLIRVGAANRQAEVEVHFHNSHDLPWQPATLNGKEFTSTLPAVLRLRRVWRARMDSAVLSTGMSNKYELWWDEAWHKIRADDLQQLVQYFNIQVSNPCVILTQERSKKFLAQGDHRDKYKFFVEATQLDKLKEKHNEGLRRVQAMVEEISGGKQSLGRMEKEREQLREWVTRKQMKDEAKRTLDTVRALEAWARWKERRDERDRQQQTIEGLEQQKQQLSAELQGLELDQGQFEEEKRKRMEEVHRRMAELEAAKRVTADALAKVEAHKVKARQAVNRMEALSKKRERGQRELERKEAEIEQVRTEMEEQNATAENERIRKVTELEEERKRNEASKADLLRGYGELRHQMSTTDERMKKCQQDERGSVERLRELETQLQSFRAAQQRGGSRFGARTAELRAAIQRRQSQFSALPLGPLGDFMQISKADELYLTAIESCITKAGLCAYVVSSVRDRGALKAVFREVLGAGDREWPMIIVQPKRAVKQYDDPAKRGQPYPLAPHRRVLDCMQVDDPWVYNTLVDQKEVEMSVVYPRNGRDAHDTIAGAYQLLSQLKGSPHFRAIYTENGVKLAPKGESTTKHTEYKGRLLAADLREEIVRVEKAREDGRKEMEHHRAQRERLARDRRDVEVQMRHAMDSVKKVDVAIAELQQALEEVEREQRGVRREEDVVHLQRERERFIAEVGELDAQLSDAKDEAQRINIVREEAMERLRAAEGAEEAAEGRVTEARQWVDQFASSRAELKASLEQKQQKLRGLTERHAKVSTHVQAETAALAEEETSLLSEYGRVSVDDVVKSRDAYTREVKKAELRLQEVVAKIQAMAKRGGKRAAAAKDVDIDRMALQFEQQSKACDELATRLQRLEGDSKWLSTAMKKRQAKWAEYRQRLGERLQAMYQLYLSKSHKAGTIILDHDQETLDIPRVQDMAVKEERSDTSASRTQQQQRLPASAAPSPSSSASNSSKTMSGGEKSIITVAFLMSLWRSVDCPWRAMDEFDVFQDSINRATSMDLLIRGAAHTPSRQFLFLTPLDVTGVLRPGVSVKEMPKVDDTQQTLPYLGDGN